MLSNKTIEKRKTIAKILLYEGAITFLKYESKLRKIHEKTRNVKRKKYAGFRHRNEIYCCKDCGARLKEYGPCHHSFCDFCWKARKRLGLPTHPNSPLILDVFKYQK